MHVRLSWCATALALAGTTCGKEPPTTAVVAAVPAALELVSGNQQSGPAGQPLPSPLVVKVIDASGAGVPWVIVQWRVVSGGGSLSAGSTSADSSGQTSVSWTLGRVVGPDTVSAAVTGLPVLFLASTAIAGPAAQLVFRVQPRGAWATQMMPAVAVAVADAAGNTVTTATDTITVTLGANPGAGTLAGTASLSAVNGVASLSGLSIDKPGAGYTLVATARSMSGATSVPFSILGTFVSVGAGFGHTCGVTTGGAAACWGVNEFGGLGNGSTTNSATPVAVAGGLAFATVSVGGDVTCGVTTSGAANCWGWNGMGELGNGLAADSSCYTISESALAGPRCPTPMAVSGGLTFSTVSAGAHHVCGLTTSGSAYCWGWGSRGQLGSGSTIAPQLCPVVTCSPAPVPVSGGITFAAMSAGGHHTCGVATDGTTYCWGSNASGQLGIGTADSAPRPAPLLVTGGLTFATVSAAGGNTCSPTPLYAPYCWAAGYTCGVTAVGAAQCWGNNQYGQIGNGSTTASSIPVPVSGGLTFETVSATDSYSCGLTTTGAAFCWGDNQFGQLGNGSTTASSIPVPVSGGLSFANVSAGGDHTCGVTTGGAAYCWGNNQSGQLGDGSTTSSTTPVLVRRS